MSQGAKIVVGESDRAVLELIQIRLDLAGYHACIARDGHSLLELLKSVRPAAMIIDASLAGLSALEVLQALAERGAASYPVLLTGKNLAAEDIRRAVPLGVRDCLAKPFSATDMLERVGRLLRAPPRPAPQAVSV